MVAGKYITRPVSDEERNHYSKIYFANFSGYSKIPLITFLKEVGGFVAGGSFKNIDLQDEDGYAWFNLPRDFDIYFRDSESFDEALLKMGTFPKIFSKNYETDNAVGFNSSISIQVELVKRNFGSPEEIIDDFDFTVVKKALFFSDDGELMVTYHKDYEDDKNNKVLNFDGDFLERVNDFEPHELFERLVKYVNYKYVPSDKCLGVCSKVFTGKLPAGRAVSVDNLRNFVNNPLKFINTDRYRVGSVESSSYYNSKLREQIFDDLVRHDFVEVDYTSRVDELLHKIFPEQFYHNSMSVHLSVQDMPLVNIAKLYESLRKVEKEYADGFPSDEYKAQVFILIIFGMYHINGYSMWSLLDMGIGKFGKSFVDFLIDLWFSSSENVLIPPYTDWFTMIQLGDDSIINLPPSIALPLYFNSEGKEYDVENYKKSNLNQMIISEKNNSLFFSNPSYIVKDEDRVDWVEFVVSNNLRPF